MAARATGWGMLCSASVQEAQDLALIAHAATLESRIPFLHFFDGFRTSHEISKIDILPDDVLRAMIDEARVIEHRARALSPDHPVIRGTAQNPDVYFQARETVNPFYALCPGLCNRPWIVSPSSRAGGMASFEYHGATDAEHVIVLMGSGCEAVHETVDFLAAQNQKVGVAQGAAVPAVRRNSVRQNIAPDRTQHCRSRPNERTGLGRRAALSGLRQRVV